MHPAERGSYVTLPARLSQWDFNYGPAIDGSIQMSDYQKDDRNRDSQKVSLADYLKARIGDGVRFTIGINLCKTTSDSHC